MSRESNILTRADFAQLEESGIGREEAERQLALFSKPPAAMRLVRPCSIGDGVRVLTPQEQEDFVSRSAVASAAGRLSKFVPASGAASRMFETLISASGPDGAGNPALAEFIANLERFAFHESLAMSLAESGIALAEAVAGGDYPRVVERLLEQPGLGYQMLPKALLEFHRYDGGSRTAFEEHLIEAAPYLRDRDGLCRLHFTVSEEHRSPFTELLERLRRPLAELCGATFDVGFSVQSPATDMLAVDLENRPFRLADGRLLLRPGGHGALIRNLSEVGADVVLVKNIDNVVPDSGKELVTRWKRVLVGHLVALQERSFDLLESLEGSGGEPALGAGLEFVASELGSARAAEIESADVDRRRAYLLDRLSRPLRVCGVVRNQGEPGGGPFWVAAADGEPTPQIVEESQTADDEAQRRIFRSGTHFNPVDLVCGTRDRHGRPFDLERFVDPSAVFISQKSQDGRELKALERPGLWNGAMAQWNTVFVEVPAETFAPVKTVFDLLRPAHQPG